MAASTNDSTIEGPATSFAARPVSVKMPAPMMTPTPNTTRSSAVSRFLSWYSGSSPSRSYCSIGMVRMTLMACPSARLHRPHRR